MVIKMKYQRIKDLREDSDLTQSQIGEKLNNEHMLIMKAAKGQFHRKF